jgi:DNA-binding SARP family transcriptional activator
VSNDVDNSLRVAVLGQVRVWVDDAEVSIGPARQRTILAVLAVRANRIVVRDDLIEAVWGQSAPATASGSVYTYISGLRRALEPGRSPRAAGGVLSSTSSGYSLRLGDGALDADRFGRLYGEAKRQAADGEREAAVAAVDEALALWRGEAFAGLAGPFVDLERQRLGDLRIAAIELRARLYIELGGPAEVLAELAVLVRDHPLNETLRELLMLALYRAGRPTDALEAYRAARQTLVQELGIEPGESLRELHRHILDDAAETPSRAQLAVKTDEPTAARSATAGGPRLSVVPTHVARALTEGVANRPFVGRPEALTALRTLVRDVATGAGRAVWIDGEPGIGKSELLTMAFADAAEHGCQLAWSVADELTQVVPLQVIIRALGLEATSADPRLARLAERLHGDSAGGDGAAAAEGIVAAVRELCDTAPLILVIDDMQWADEASRLLWERLATVAGRLPLLVVGASRPEPSRLELSQLRRSVEARNGVVLTLPPLSCADVETLIGTIVGAALGANLRGLAPQAAGNPLYARELTSALIRRAAVTVVDGTADVERREADAVPQSLLAAVRATVDHLSAGTQSVLRLAALLGMEFSASELAAVTATAPYELARTLDEAVTAHVIVDAGEKLAFRHPFLREALSDSIPRSMRATLRRQAAEALARTGSAVTRVAEQLAAEAAVIDTWAVDWLTGHHAELGKHAPIVAGDLIRRVLNTDLPTVRQRSTLLLFLVKLMFRQDSFPEPEAQEAFATATDPADRAEMRNLLAATRYRQGDVETAMAMLRDAVDDPEVPQIWRTRHRVLLANFQRGDLSDLDAADRRARDTYSSMLMAGRRYEAAFALQTLWLTASIRRDHAAALDAVDRALVVVGDDPEITSLHLDLLDNRMFSLQNLDRLDDAQETLRTAADVAQKHRLPRSLQVAAAVQHYWKGRWDQALAEVGSVTDESPGVTFHGTREPGAVAMLLHGVAALIACRRDDPMTALTHIEATDRLPASSAERESCDFLLVARALVAERDGEAADCLELLAPLLQVQYAPMQLRHQWLPDIVRLALSAQRPDIARQAATICAEEADRERVPARAFAAAARCQALIHDDQQAALRAADHYRRVGRATELAAALEDAAVLLAKAGRHTESARVFSEAIQLYTVLSARSDIRRAINRLEEFGSSTRTTIAS